MIVRIEPNSKMLVLGALKKRDSLRNSKFTSNIKNDTIPNPRQELFTATFIYETMRP